MIRRLMRPYKWATCTIRRRRFSKWNKLCRFFLAVFLFTTFLGLPGRHVQFRLKQDSMATNDDGTKHFNGTVDCLALNLFYGNNSIQENINRLCHSPLNTGNFYAKVLPAYWDHYIASTNANGVIEEAYVSFIRGDAYAKLVTAVVKAAGQFSKKPLLLFVSGALAQDPEVIWPPDEHPRLVVFHMPAAPMHPWFDKLIAAILSPVKRGVILEADTLITHNADRLFAILRAYEQEPYPLMPGHPDLRWENCSMDYNKETRYCSHRLSYPHNKRSMDYVHAHLMWTEASKPFLIDVLLDCIPGQKRNKLDCSSDETALNYALWNAKVSKQLCLMDPHHTFLSAWETLDTDQLYDGLKKRTIGFLFVHGSKNADLAEALVDRIAAMKEKPWLLEKGTWSSNSEIGVHEDGCIL